MKKIELNDSSEFSDVCYKYIIGEIVKHTKCTNYIELGVYFGDSLEYISQFVRRAIGVDLNDRRINKVGEFYEMSTDNFFESFGDNADIIFIDADHKIDSVIRDFENSLKILNKYGIIFLHDTDPRTEEYIKPGFCNDSYKVVDYLLEKHPELNVVTLPISNAGLTIVMRKDDRRVFNFINAQN